MLIGILSQSNYLNGKLRKLKELSDLPRNHGVFP
jgi:hypothetical protein